MTDLQRAIDATANAIPTMSARQLHEALVTAQETIDALARRVAELGCELAESQKQVAAWHAVADRRTAQEEAQRAARIEMEASRERLRKTLQAIDDSDLDIVTFDRMWSLLYPSDLEPMSDPVTTSSTGPSMAEMGPPMTALADALLWQEARASVALDHDPRGQTLCARDFEGEGEHE